MVWPAVPNPMGSKTPGLVTTTPPAAKLPCSATTIGLCLSEFPDCPDWPWFWALAEVTPKTMSASNPLVADDVSEPSKEGDIKTLRLERKRGPERTRVSQRAYHTEGAQAAEWNYGRPTRKPSHFRSRP